MYIIVFRISIVHYATASLRCKNPNNKHWVFRNDYFWKL